MTKKKIVMKIQMINCDKRRKKAFEIAAAADGVDSVTIEGKEKELLTVTGICVDAVRLVSKMRKKFGCTELVSVEEVKPKQEKKEEPKVEKKEKVVSPCCVPPCPPCPQLVAYGTVYDPSPSICSIM